MKKKALSLFLALGLMCPDRTAESSRPLLRCRQQRLRKKEMLPRKAQERLKRLQAHRK